MVNGFAKSFIAGFTATNKLYGILEIAASSYGHAVTSYTGQNFGAGRWDRIRKGVRWAAGISLLTSGVISAIMVLFGREITMLFISREDAALALAAGDTAYHYLCVMSAALPMLYLLFGYRTTLQGIGDTFIPMVSGFVELVMRILCAVVLPLFMGEWGIYLSEIAAWVGAAILLMWGYYHRMAQLDMKMKSAE